jgi:hypothetical protein
MDHDKPKVLQLVPMFCAPTKDPASPGRVRAAFVAHTMFFHEADAQAVQLDRLAQSGVDDRDTIVRYLCESYSRAVFESLFALHFDSMDPRADEQLLAAIGDTFGDEVAHQVHAVVELRGVVIARSSIARPVQQHNASDVAQAERTNLSHLAPAENAKVDE